MEKHRSSVPPWGCQEKQAGSFTCFSFPAAAMAGERDEASKQAEELRTLLHLPGCSTISAHSLLRASVCGLRVKIVGILGTAAILLTKGSSSLVFLLLKVRYK